MKRWLTHRELSRRFIREKSFLFVILILHAVLEMYFYVSPILPAVYTLTLSVAVCSHQEAWAAKDVRPPHVCRVCTTGCTRACPRINEPSIDLVFSSCLCQVFSLMAQSYFL